MQSIVILGASGFIGSKLLSRLLESDNSIKLLLRKSFYISDGSPLDSVNLQITRGDLSNIQDWKQIFQPGDIVFNFISPSTPSSSSDTSLNEVENHIKPQVELIQAACDAEVEKLIYFSSGGGLYGNHHNHPITESEVLHPSSPHAIAKASIEYFQEFLGAMYRVPTLTYRISNPYGPGQLQKPGFGLIPSLFSHILTDTPPTLFDYGEAVRDFIYIEDLIDAILCSYDKENLHPVYNVGSGLGTKTIDVWNTIKEISGSHIEPLLRPKRDFDVDKFVLDTHRFSDEFGWKNLTSLQLGLEKTWQWTKQTSS